MKTIPFTFCFLFVILLFACSNSETSIPKVSGKGLVGDWYWIRTTSANSTGTILTPESTGINEVMLLDSAKNWYDYKNNKLVNSGIYCVGHIKRKIAIYEYEYDSICYFQNSKIIGYDYYSLSTDTLIFDPEFAGFYGGQRKVWIRK
jgi:hypothetical protein